MKDSAVPASIQVSPTVFAAIKKAEGPIPELRPPREEIAFSLPESAFFNGALVFALGVLLVGRYLQLRRVRPVPPPLPAINRARLALAGVHPDQAIDDCPHIVRHYLAGAYELSTDGATTKQLLTAYAAHPLAEPAAAEALAGFFADCDLARFAPHTAGALRENLAERTRALVEQLEISRQALRPPPLPPAPAPPPSPPPLPLST